MFSYESEGEITVQLGDDLRMTGNAYAMSCMLARMGEFLLPSFSRGAYSHKSSVRDVITA